ncbi:50S ribosomal protein L10 [Gloeobacter violaceus]|uniref:Large ribosomal subunit protein uL10 n=1 Tax=Gloeobacter violaceus (strain ATCC 29082 / PCC 7421) TaxID=251221 RepID=RL10_GLOVI|nr:50S ribosomal protein L10 [Gloeobacter violaceus]Q7NK77.1 RecName: Full=Large ribosomal subunit protein uL10; AltName: Full=50S ribosomal protein L10 [Gloeobacter violaceus PCC 7421]BAC89542.1 50S ribosomal protein L10 [Gloeobacter violaceus PCC 7421]
MGKRPVKEALVGDLQKLLEKSSVVMVIDYRGLSVAEITGLRRRMREHGGTCVVAKNTLMGVATRETAWRNIDPLLAGPSAFLFGNEKLKEMLKTYEDFARETKKTEFRGAVVDGTLVTLDGLKAIADLPPKEVLLAQFAGALKVLPTKIAVGINQVPTKVAVGINEVPAGLARVLEALRKQKEEQQQPQAAA